MMHLRSGIIFLLGRLVPDLFGLVTAAVLTRLLEPAEYGLYALGLSITFFWRSAPSIGSVLACCGWHPLLNSRICFLARY